MKRLEVHIHCRSDGSRWRDTWQPAAQFSRIAKSPEALGHLSLPQDTQPGPVLEGILIYYDMTELPSPPMGRPPPPWTLLGHNGWPYCSGPGEFVFSVTYR